MKTDYIYDMPAGRELDALIAEKVMGLNLKHLPAVYEERYTSDGKDGWSGFVCPRCRYPQDMLDGPCCQQYSTNIFAAWEVVEKMGAYKLETVFRSIIRSSTIETKHRATFW